MYDFLKKVPLFSDLSNEDLERLCEMVTEVFLPAGGELFTEGSMGNQAFVIKEGQIEILKSSGGKTVLLAIRLPGDVIGEMALLEAAPRMASGVARTDSVLLAIGQEQLDNLLNTSTSAARALLHTFVSRLRSTELMLRQSEKMAQLGTLTAGIAHEINNPAAAAQRGAQQLINEISRLQQYQMQIGNLVIPDSVKDTLVALDELARKRASQPVDLDSLTRSDREYELETWLAEHDIENSWELAPQLVNLGYPLADLQSLSSTMNNTQLAIVINWLGLSYTVYSLLEEIKQGSERISEIVKALKTYVYLDQAPIQAVDLHEGLDNTLIMLRSKLKGGVNVQRDYADSLPRIEVYGSELNQVWTNLIDNAIDAMDGKGEITLRTRYKDPWVIIEVEDNGPGIPEEIQGKIFSPFFTTKSVGKGTGLGLNISYNIVNKHGGEIKVFSQPGKTRFEVWLPKNLNGVNNGAATIAVNPPVGDEMLRQILVSTKNIAVVGITDHRDQPSHTVPAYLQSHGYTIIPVNPYLNEVLGEKVVPDLKSVSKSVDIVLIFRRAEAVPPIVEDAINIGAKVVWMQEGIVNEAAAKTASNAGLKVVMDTCLRATHKRLFQE